MTIESCHFRNSEDSNTTEGTCLNVKDLTFSDVRNEFSVTVALQTIECNIGSSDVTLESTTCEIRIRTGWLKQSVLDQLILDRTIAAHLARRCVTAMEAHKCICKLVVLELILLLIIDVLRYRVVDVKESNSIIADADTDILGKSAVDINFAGYRNTTGSKTAVNIARLESELGRECRPALICKCYILSGTLVSFCPVKKSKFELSHTSAHLRIVLTFAHFFGHIFADLRNTRVILVLLIRNEKIELGILFDLNAQLIKTLDRCITSEEVLRTWTKCDDLKILNANNRTSDRYEISDHFCDIFSCSDRIFWNISVKMSHTEVV